MPLRGQIQPDHIPVNKYRMIIPGLPDLTLTEISGLEQEIDVVDLPDRTKASGGNTQALEITAMLPAHHTIQVAAVEAWYLEGKDPVSATYKKTATLVQLSGSGSNFRSYTLIGMWLSKRKTADLSMENEGEMAQLELTFQIDDVLPI